MTRLSVRVAMAAVIAGVAVRTAGADTITTVAGTGVQGFNGNDIAATSAQLYSPWGLAFDTAGNLLIADWGNSLIRKVDRNTRVISAVAGNRLSGLPTGDGGQATAARVSSPYCMAAGPTGDVFISDALHRIRMVNHLSGTITTVVGDGTGSYNGDNIPATTARINVPSGIVIDASGTVYFAEEVGARIRKVDAGTWTIVTVAGTGVTADSADGIPATTASLNTPEGIAVDGSGNVFVAEFLGHRVRKIYATTGLITTVAGTGTPGYNGDGIPAATAKLDHPWGVVLDAAGNLFIGDTFNHRVRKVDAVTQVVTTVAGTGAWGLGAEGVEPTESLLAYPTGVAVDATGSLWISDYGYDRIRKVSYGTSRQAQSRLDQVTGKMPRGSLMVAPNVMGPSTAAASVSFFVRGTPGAVVEARVFNASGRSMGSVRITLDGAGKGEGRYPLAGVEGRKPGPGIYWVVIDGGGVSDRRRFFVAAGGR